MFSIFKIMVVLLSLVALTYDPYCNPLHAASGCKLSCHTSKLPFPTALSMRGLSLIKRNKEPMQNYRRCSLINAHFNYVTFIKSRQLRQFFVYMQYRAETLNKEQKHCKRNISLICKKPYHQLNILSVKIYYVFYVYHFVEGTITLALQV